MVEEPRKCSGCKESKPESDFYTKGKGRRSFMCKSCDNEKNRLRRSKAPATPQGGWTVDNLQEHYNNSGSDVTVISVGSSKDFLKAGFDVVTGNKLAYVQNNATGERFETYLNSTLSPNPGVHNAKHIKTMERVVKKLREMDKGLGLLSTDPFYKISNKNGDISYLNAEDTIKDGYTYDNANKHVHLINHKTSQTRYFQVFHILSGVVPWGSGGYDPESPGVFYLVMINDSVIKFGITNNTVSTRYSGEYLDFKKYVTILEVKFDDGTIPQKMERMVSRMVKDHRYNGPKVFRTTKNRECFWYGDGIKLCEVLGYVKDVKDKENGEMITWENTVTSRGSRKTSTQQSIPMQLSLAL